MSRYPNTPVAFKDEPDQTPPPGHDHAPERQGDDRAEEENSLSDHEGGSRQVCAVCRSPITTTAARDNVNGSHRHVFCNPGGYVYEIGCFSAAPGCGTVDQPSTEFTWFPGHAWQVAVCRSCLAHLGWKFLGRSSTFFGLILDRLRQSDAEGA